MNTRVWLSAGLTLFCGALCAEETERISPSDLFRDQCAVCHGENLGGAAQGTPLVGVDLVHGDSVDEIAGSISSGFPDKGMPEWSKTLREAQIRTLALYVAETRLGLNYNNFNYSTPFAVPEDEVASQLHAFRLETVIDGLDSLPFSIEPLPDGRILLTEKKLGLSIVSADGRQSALIEGTPRAYDDTYVIGVEQEWGHGWMLDVALHPDYEKNGWVYLHFGDRCSDCNALSRAEDSPVSMNKLIRGRIDNGRWVDEETIWQTDVALYGTVPDIGSGGRISFDGEGHVFFSVGIRGIDNHTGVQDLSKPWGKIHRVIDDGRIPTDNPFIDLEGAVKSIWTYGHRSPQGWNSAT